MSLDAIMQVTQAEQEAAQKLAVAQVQARKIISDAKEEGMRIIEQSRITAQSESKRLMTEAELKAAKSAAAVMEQTQQDCARLRALAEGRLESAVALIVGRVVNT